MQPEWRGVEGICGPLKACHWTGTGDWSVLDKPGQNGLLSVLMGLTWWGETMYKSEMAVIDACWWAEWECTMEDVHDVMVTMLKGKG